MNITGIICEYNPLHLGHRKQLAAIRGLLGADSGIVCLMSGNYVQRGAPAIVDKLTRAKAAVLCGADLVLELPVTACLSSAEGFAAEGVRILSGFCSHLCFGAETADARQLLQLAQALLQPEFSRQLHIRLEQGLSFPAARQAALEDMGTEAAILATPNNILAVEYCKAILAQASPLEILPIHRPGSYHAMQASSTDPSATAVRALMTASGDWLDYIPQEALPCFAQAPLHTLAAGERAMLARLRCMDEADFAVLPHGSEGLWRKFMHAARKEATLEDILTATKSKRYTRTRLDRMAMCAFLGITDQMLRTPAPYTRVLACTDRGREILKQARRGADLPNTGQRLDHPYQTLEDRCGDLYGLFADGRPEPPGTEAALRIYCHET